jgi:hypothetical protein
MPGVRVGGMGSTITFTPEVPEDLQSQFNAALAASRFKMSRAFLQITVGYTLTPATWDPIDWNVVERGGDVPMCYLTLRRLPAAQFTDAVVHALGHLFFAVYTPTSLWTSGFGYLAEAGRDVVGDDLVAATWEDNASEAIAEFFRDVYLPQRPSDNRTNWQMRRTSFGEFVAEVHRVLCPAQAS